MEFRADLGRFNLWRPMVVNKIRGSGWTWALSSADFGNFNLRFPKSSIEPAAATGSGVCPDAEFGNSNVWFPNSSTEPAAASGTGPCPAADFGRFSLWRPTVVERTRGSRWDRALPGGGSADMSFPGSPGKPKTSAALIYGGR